MAQYVGSSAWRLNAGTSGSAIDYVAHCLLTQRTIRSPAAQKNVSAVCFWSAILEVGQDRVADTLW